MKTIAILAALLLSGCATPDYARTAWSHVSSPARGWPVSAPDTEDTLDTLDVYAGWHKDRYFIEVGLGYQLADGGFVGDDVIFTSRVGVEIWSRK